MIDTLTLGLVANIRAYEVHVEPHKDAMHSRVSITVDAA